MNANQSSRGAPPLAVRKAVVGLGFLAVLADGFDTAILALLVPHLADAWGLRPADFTYPLVLTNIGVVLGYLAAGHLARRIGSKNLLIAGTLVFSIATLGSAASVGLESMSALTLTRGITGIGLGIVLPTAVVVGTQNGPAVRKQAIAVCVTMGLITGATVAGFSGAILIRSLGTSGVLWLTGAFPLIVAMLVWFLVPRSPAPIDTVTDGRQSVANGLLGKNLRVPTLVLWTATFLVFVASYTLKSWLPTLFLDYGLAKDTAGLGLAFFSLGGVAAGLVLIPITARFSAVRALVVTSLIAVAAIAAIALLSVGTAILMGVTFVAGLGLTSCSIGQTAIAVGMYEEAMRATAVGWSAAAGRIGSIVGPAAAGLLLGLNWAAPDVVLLLVVPVALTSMCWFYLVRWSSQSAGSREGSASVPSPSH